MCDDPKFEKQVISEITFYSIFGSAINGIIGFIAVYLFKPFWDKLMAYINPNNKDINK